MSAPGADHELRVELLDACAALSGHTLACRLSDRDIPDVVRVDLRHRRLFVGDGKDTETPGCAATSARLHSYARALRPWLTAGFSARLAVCHGRAEHDAGWTAVLEHAVRCAALDATPGAAEQLEPGAILTWVDVRALVGDTTRRAPSSVLDDVVRLGYCPSRGGNGSTTKSATPIHRPLLRRRGADAGVR